ncbi:MAG: phage terminase small subunit P27 family [Arhodomonas sp.]|nr:phage terminase small subunit P27 family [Arhodomonas sp.]
MTLLFLLPWKWGAAKLRRPAASSAAVADWRVRAAGVFPGKRYEVMGDGSAWAEAAAGECASAERQSEQAAAGAVAGSDSAAGGGSGSAGAPHAGGLKEWDRLSGELRELGLISQIDRAAFAVYCQAYGRWVRAEERMAELGDEGLVETAPSGYRQMSVWLQISNRATDQMKSFLAEFGMTPSARSRVTPSTRRQRDLFDAQDGEDDTGGGGPQRFFT